MDNILMKVHDATGFLIFVIAFALLYFVVKILEEDEPAKWKRMLSNIFLDPNSPSQLFGRLYFLRNFIISE